MLGGGVLAFFAAAGGHAVSGHGAHLAHLAHQLRNAGGAALAVSGGAVTSGPAADLGQSMAAAYGWTSGNGQFTCLNWLWTKESNWDAYAANPASSARGIPQDINGWADFAPGDVTAQIRWGLAYIQGRYGNPCSAWSHETSQGWY
jgi:hypothetical protein